jgi:hypothetical protein
MIRTQPSWKDTVKAIGEGTLNLVRRLMFKGHACKLPIEVFAFLIKNPKHTTGRFWRP